MVANDRDYSEDEFGFACPFHSYIGCDKDSGYYYLSPEICKDIVIDFGVRGIHTSKAIKKVRNNINYIGEVVERAIPAFRFIDPQIIYHYGSEFAECLVEAAGDGKGLDIVIGYPKVLVFKVS
ncbi:MAG: hypothetical protein GX359_05810 [Clostridiales bacterium]|nr:hypothetical protein [Clostridiales bacterium]